jgi:transposase
VACAYHSAADHTFQSVPTSRDDLARLIARTRPAVVVVEACTPAGWVHELCEELGVRCAVANTASDQWKYKHTKRKTDRDDAPASRNCTPSASSRRWSSRPGGCASGGH